MEKRSWKGWSEWSPLLMAEGIPCGPGTYLIAAHKKLSRLVGHDGEGILTIGESDNLQKRIISFISCAKGTRHRGHTAGWRYRELGYGKLFPLDKLWVSWKPTASKEEAYFLEGNLLKEYASQHFELPPLNYKYNWSDHEQ